MTTLGGPRQPSSDPRARFVGRYRFGLTRWYTLGGLDADLPPLQAGERYGGYETDAPNVYDVYVEGRAVAEAAPRWLEVNGN